MPNLRYHRARCLIELGLVCEAMYSLVEELSINPENRPASTLLKSHKADFAKAMESAPAEKFQLAFKVLNRLTHEQNLANKGIAKFSGESYVVDQMCGDKVDVDKTKVRTRYSNLGDRLDIYRYAADRFSEKSLSFKDKLLSGVYTIRKYPCPICNNINEWHSVVFSDEGFEWSVCKRCGLLQQNCRLTPQALKEFYGSGEYSEISMAGLVGERAFTLEYEASSVHLDNLTNQGYDFSRLAVLDIGCGYGGTLLALKELGATVKGFDLDPQSVCFGQNYVKEIEVGDALDFNHDLSKYNLILLNNIIEHLSCPVEFLLRLREKIKNSNVQVFIDVPNLEGAHSYYHNPDNNYIIEFLHLSHIWYFTSVSLERLLNQVGFRVTYINNRGAAMTVLCSKSESLIPNNNNSLILSLSSIDYGNHKFQKSKQKDN